MQKTLLLIALLFSVPFFGQTAYIEVKGEPDLSVYLNSMFKGETTAELNGMIIENVTPGKNLIKIVKEGYTPFEETITVKPGEVLAYKVKPFTKHVVLVSEEGNTEETSKQATLKTGKLVIQSVPIEIKITIPDIDGIDKSPKTKDKWLAEEIPAGNYEVTFTYNHKEITKTVKVIGDETTSVFVNMLGGDFKSTNSLDEKNEKARKEYQRYYKLNNFVDSLFAQYKVKKGLTESQLRNQNKEADQFMTSFRYILNYNTRYHYSVEELWKSPGINSIYFNEGSIEQYHYSILCGKGTGIQVNDQYNKIVAHIKSTIPAEFITEKAEVIEIRHPDVLITVDKGFLKKGRDGFIDLGFLFYGK
jgi:hypothetical protein